VDEAAKRTAAAATLKEPNKTGSGSGPDGSHLLNKEIYIRIYV
jgi:hypothetical protein